MFKQAFLKLILIFIVILNYLPSFNAQTFLNDQLFKELIDELARPTFNNQTRMMIFFRVVQKKKKKKDMNFFTGVLRDFLITIDVDAETYNWNHEHIIAVVKPNNYPDKDLILSHFEGILDEMAVRSPMEFKPKDEH
jgi:hypothetical protein